MAAQEGLRACCVSCLGLPAPNITYVSGTDKTRMSLSAVCVHNCAGGASGRVCQQQLQQAAHQHAGELTEGGND